MLTRLPGHVAEVWEGLARRSVPHLAIDALRWNPASRWWGRGVDDDPLEIDVVSESSDRRHLLLGEAKWTDGPTRTVWPQDWPARRAAFRSGTVAGCTTHCG